MTTHAKPLSVSPAIWVQALALPSSIDLVTCQQLVCWYFLQTAKPDQYHRLVDCF